MTSQQEFNILIEGNDFTTDEQIAIKAMYETHAGNPIMLNNLVIEKLVNKKSLLKESYSAEEIGFINDYLRPNKDLDSDDYAYPFPSNDFIVKTWALAYKHGFNADGTIYVIEAGKGNFCKYAPKNSSAVIAFEENEVCQKIIEATYPSVQIHEDYESMFFLEKAALDYVPKPSLVIGCAPSGVYDSAYAMMGEKKKTGATYWYEYYLVRGAAFLEENGLFVLLINDVYLTDAQIKNIKKDPMDVFLEIMPNPDSIAELNLKCLGVYFIKYKYYHENNKKEKDMYRAIIVWRKERV